MDHESIPKGQKSTVNIPTFSFQSIGIDQYGYV